MSSKEGQENYKKRGSTAEFVNAQAKNRGMRAFLVKGIEKAKNMALIYAITHNMVTYWGVLSS